MFFISGSPICCVEVEEGSPAVLECPGFVPKPQDKKEVFANFNWYKARLSSIDGPVLSENNRVASYDKITKVHNTSHELKNRATVNITSGALKIEKTKVSDEHVYTCYFNLIATGSRSIKSETNLVVTGK